MQDRIGFVERISALAESLGVEMSEGKLWAYEQALSDYSDPQIAAAISIALKTCKFFPKPVELIELIEGRKEDQASLAWEALLDTMQRVGTYQSILFEDGRIARAVRLLGGWQVCCQWKTEELKFLRIDFLKVFSSLPIDTAPEVLDGIAAINASAHGYADRIPEPVRIPCLSNQCGTAAIIAKKLDRMPKITGFSSLGEIIDSQKGVFQE